MQSITYGYADDDHVAIGDAARILGVSITTVRRYVEGGRLTSRRTPGGHHRFNVAQIRALLDSVPAEQPPTELVWPHHYTHSDGSELCEWSGRPAESGQEECPSGHEHLPIAVSPLMPAVRAS
ncbi:MAG: MerR family transcriptional regulator [Gammaproteobacteria bacterium]